MPQTRSRQAKKSAANDGPADHKLIKPDPDEDFIGSDMRNDPSAMRYFDNSPIAALTRQKKKRSAADEGAVGHKRIKPEPVEDCISVAPVADAKPAVTRGQPNLGSKSQPHQGPARQKATVVSAALPVIKPDPVEDSTEAIPPVSPATTAKRAAVESERQLYANGIITLKVGPTAEVITIHEQRLRKTSRYFRTVLGGKRQDGNSRGIMLLGTVECINAYVEWLYSQRTPLILRYDGGGKDDYGYGCLVDAYVFGERIQDDTYCNDVLSSMASTMDRRDFIPSSDHIRRIYQGTSERARVRELLVSMYADVGRGSWMENVPGSFPRQFLLELSTEVLQRPRKMIDESYFASRRHWFKQAYN